MPEQTNKPFATPHTFATPEECHQVAQTILEQLGGRRFITMTGARNFSTGGQDLTFKLPIGKIGGVRIELTAMDDYTVTFYKRVKLRTVVENGGPVVASKHETVYCDTLRELFERETGLATRINMRRMP